MKNPLRIRFIRDVALTGSSQVIQAASAMLSGILIARFLGASAKGTISVLVALGSLAVLLGSLGLHLSGVYFLGRFKSDHDAVISNSVVAAVVGGITTTCVLVGTTVVFRHEILGSIPLVL